MNEQPLHQDSGPVRPDGTQADANSDLRWTSDQNPELRAAADESAPAPEQFAPAPFAPAPFAPPPFERQATTPPAGEWAAWARLPVTAMPSYEAIGGSAGQAARSGAGRRLVPLIVATAMLSAVLSAAGTFAVLTLAPRTTTVIQAGSTGTTTQAQVVSLTQSEAIIRVADGARASVVTISTSGVTGVGRRVAQFTGSGSGFIVSTDGLIVTNNHVVVDTSTLTVTLDGGKEFPATVVSTDPTHDLALIRIKATGLTPLPLGDSAAVQVGQLAIAIGSPLGTFTESVTQGIVSGLDRSISVGDGVSTFTENLSGLIQTDAAINPGNSGGPLLDAGGSVVGVVTAASSSAQDIGFAVPINQVKTMIAAATKA
jgi:S1-C subfamily serine protease